MENDTWTFTEAVEHYCNGITVAISEDYDEFSSRQCDSCGSTLAGERWHATGFIGKGRHLIENMRVCVDCAMYHANGETPAEWYQTSVEWREKDLEGYEKTNYIK
jgi:hypothetical protein